MEHVAPIITASVALLTLIGGGFKFMWVQINKKFEAVDTELAKCRDREKLATKRRGLLFSIIEVLFAEVERLHPKSKALKRHDELLQKYRTIATADIDEIEGN